MREKIRVLQYGALSGTYGGMESYIAAQWKAVDRSKIQYDFLVPENEEHVAYEEDIERLGGRICKKWVGRKRGVLRHYIALYRFFREHPYDVVVGNFLNLNNIDCLLFAWLFRVPIRVAHAHAAAVDYPSVPQKILAMAHHFCLKITATHLFACSDLAGKWLFGTLWKSKKSYVIHNGIDTCKFSFNPQVRDNVRLEYGLSDKWVVGHTGRFAVTKNHRFIISVFKELCKITNDAVLVLVGKGVLEQEIRELVKIDNLQDRVIFMGERENIQELLQGMDIFLFPSKSEGLGISLIEAQATGLKCFASEKVVPKDAAVTDLLTFLPLEESPAFWAKHILRAREYTREDRSAYVRQMGYDASDSVDMVSKVYLGMNS